MDLLEEVRELKNRILQLEQDNTGTMNWWFIQLRKHRPDLATRYDANEQELRRLRLTLEKLKKVLEG